MSRNFSLKYNSKDITISCLAVILIVAILVATNLFLNNYNKSDLVVNVYVQNQIQKDYTVELKTLEDNINYEIILTKSRYNILVADMLILVNKDKGIKVEEEESPRKICSLQGWVNLPGVPVVCLPNSVYIIIESQSIEQDWPIG